METSTVPIRTATQITHTATHAGLLQAIVIQYIGIDIIQTDRHAAAMETRAATTMRARSNALMGIGYATQAGQTAKAVVVAHATRPRPRQVAILR